MEGNKHAARLLMTMKLQMLAQRIYYLLFIYRMIVRIQALTKSYKQSDEYLTVNRLA